MKYIPIKEYTFLTDWKKVSRTASCHDKMTEVENFRSYIWYIEEQVKECENYKP